MRLLRAVVGTSHRYLSTACLHAEHDECRLGCKFCAEPCRCRCHRWPVRRTGA